MGNPGSRHVALLFVSAIATLAAILVTCGTASASCARALALANTGEHAVRTFESLLFRSNSDPRAAIQAYDAGAAATQRARGETCDDPSVQGHVLLASAGLSLIHATLELNAAPDNDRPQCPLEHREVAKSDVANAWAPLLGVRAIMRAIHTTFNRYDKTVDNAQLMASRLGMALPPLAQVGGINDFVARYTFDGSGECFHNPEP